jgi:glycosyltransferase involved in cell wall biosynthesis
MKVFFQKLFSKIINLIRSEDFPRFLSLLSCLPNFYRERDNSILTINTHDQSGGASKIAYQIANNSRNFFQSTFFVGIKKRTEDWIYELPAMVDNELSSVLNHQEKDGGWLDFSKLGSLRLRKNILFKRASIVHFHNLHGYYFSYVLLPVLGKGKKVVWTLHDDHAITGHCSFTMQCTRWKVGCGSCPSLEVYPAIQKDTTKELLYWKKKWINQLNPIIVSPSQWLADRVKLSYPNLTDIRVINNGIDTDIFKPGDKNQLREELHLPKDKFLVLFVAEFSTDNPFKGGEIVRQVIRKTTNESICFITIGAEYKSVHTHHLEFPYISDERELAKLYAACDVLFYPTNADNFPLVVLEAMSCGLLVIASAIAGIPEIINDNHNGFLVEGYSDVSNYESKLVDVYSLRNSNKYSLISESARETVVNKFSLKQMLENYEFLYRSLINEVHK